MIAPSSGRPATVMLIRDVPDGLEVFVLRRVPAMAFAPGHDRLPRRRGRSRRPGELEWIGPDPDWWSTHLGAPAPAAAALVVAAVRELFEETGVLLAGVRRAPISSAD